MQAPKVLVRGNLNPETYKILSHLAVDRGVTRAALVEEAVEAYLAPRDEEAEKEQRDFEQLKERLRRLEVALNAVIPADLRMSYSSVRSKGIGVMNRDGLPLWEQDGRIKAGVVDGGEYNGSDYYQSVQIGEAIEQAIVAAVEELVSRREEGGRDG
jgi:hypothetical protein